LWVAAKSFHSARQAANPRRWKRPAPRDELRVGEDRLDDLLSSPVEGLALRRGEDLLDPLGLRSLLGGELARRAFGGRCGSG
jgi:hypothetical protein